MRLPLLAGGEPSVPAQRDPSASLRAGVYRVIGVFTQAPISDVRKPVYWSMFAFVASAAVGLIFGIYPHVESGQPRSHRVAALRVTCY